VLGAGLSHDGSICLLKDGKICVAIEKERITRIKHDGGNDAAAMKYCLDAEGITIDDVALIVQNANFGMLAHGSTWWSGTRLITGDTPVCTISHHLAHAYSAIGTCPYDEAAVLIIDGCGNALDECIDLDGAIVPDVPAQLEFRQLCFEKDSYYLFRDGQLKSVYKDFSPWGTSNRLYPLHPNTTLHSIGGLYLAASIYVFNGFEDPGKLMGLAPYGRPGVHDFEVFDLRDGRAFVRYDWMDRFRTPAHSTEEFKSNFSHYADLAYWIQKEVERAVLYLVNARYDLAPCENLAYTGGVALNAVTNARILRESPFKRLYIQPAAGDNGLAVGCAYYGWLEVLGGERRRHDGSICFGAGYSRESTATAIAACADRVDHVETDDPAGVAAEALADGQVVGWFRGGSEFGPRALGHRSILANPSLPHIRGFINAEIKHREDFRPFAPSVPLDEVSTYFDCAYESPYMILVAPVRDEWRSSIPAVVHEDRSARIQTVTEDSDPVYYRLMKRFKERTGFAVVLNTSFNKRGMPIVETPAEALSFFLGCPLDLLVIDGFIVRKRAAAPQPAADLAHYFAEHLPRRLEQRGDITAKLRGIYQVRVLSPRVWTLDLTKSRPQVIQGQNGNRPDIAIELEEADLQQLLRDPISEGQRLLGGGKVRVEGKPAWLSKMVRLLDCG